MAVQPITNANVFQFSRIASYREGSSRVALPVDRNMVLYSRYKHVRGVPSIGGGGTLPLDRLRVLDNLIDRLMSLKSGGLYAKNVDRMTTREIDELIKQYEAELHQTAKRQIQFPQAPTNRLVGLVVDLVA